MKKCFKDSFDTSVLPFMFYNLMKCQEIVVFATFC